LEILAEHFKVPKSRIAILKGTKSRKKTVQVVLAQCSVAVDRLAK